MPGIDLHTHSSVSDGTESPAELVAAAVAAGLDVVALTDHDSTAGWTSAFVAAEGTGITVVPGLELSTQLDYASVHVLGYLVDPENAGAASPRPPHPRGAAASRRGHGRRASPPTTRSTGTTCSPRPRPARPSAARTSPMPSSRAATCRIASAAFQSILHWRGGYYRPHEAPPPVDGVRLIAEAGGVPVIAHPGGRGPERLFTSKRIGAAASTRACSASRSTTATTRRRRARRWTRARARSTGSS